MGIDGIGKGTGGLPIGGINPADRSEVGAKPTGEFKVSAATSAEPAAPTALDRLRSGELSVEQYLDIQVHEATAHLDGRLQPDQLSFVRDSLREQLSTDPLLVDLVKSATGALPPSRE
jgi:hypothetical protein